MVFMLLTVPPRGNRDHAYSACHRAGVVFRKRLKRRFGLGRFIAVAEAFPKSGFPHFNMVLESPGLAAALRENETGTSSELKSMACASGFGFFIGTPSVIRDSGGVAGYVAKLAGELTKDSQVPVMAPRRFRRVRASRGFLPPCPRDEDVTGIFVNGAMPTTDEERIDYYETVSSGNHERARSALPTRVGAVGPHYHVLAGPGVDNYVVVELGSSGVVKVGEGFGFGAAVTEIVRHALLH
jgi:hypothetical protein